MFICVCIAVDVQNGGCGLFLPSVSLLTARLFESAGVDCAACMRLLCACVHHMMKQHFSVPLTVFTGQFVFRVRLGWDTDTVSSTDLTWHIFFLSLILTALLSV